MRMKVSAHGRDGGFTLIEIMVVIAIIASLIGAGSLMLSIGQKRKMKTATEGRVMGLGAALEQIKSNEQLGRYPPTELAKLNGFAGFDAKKFGPAPNATNVGIETLYVVFRLKGITVKPQGLDSDDCIGNTDEDSAMMAVGDMQKPDLFEYLDAWGNPLVYIQNADYKSMSKVEEYVTGKGEHIKVAPKKNEKTGEFLRADSFQLMSLGPDGKPDTGDEIVYGVQ